MLSASLGDMSSVGNTASLEAIIRAVKNNGSDQWLDIGLELGVNYTKLNALVEGVPLAGKLTAVIEHQRRALRDDQLKIKLLDACSNISNPIIGAVEDELKIATVRDYQYTASVQNSGSIRTPIQESASINSRLEQKVTSKEAVKVAKKISHTWDEVAAILEPDTFSVRFIENIRKQHDSPFTQARVMLDHWLNTLDQNATCRALIEALIETNFTAQAKDVFGPQLVQLAQN